MSNAKHQAAWRARQRERGSRPVREWLPQFNFTRLAQVCQTHNLTRGLVINHILAWGFDKMPRPYWSNLVVPHRRRKRT